MKKNTLSALVLASALLIFAPVSLIAASWTGGTGNWSSNGNPGWNGTGVPDGVGAVATFNGGGSSATTTQDIVAGITLGKIELTTGNLTRTITATNALVLDQDGGGSGFATISNSDLTAGTNRLQFGSGSVLTLADDLLIINTGASANTTASILITGTLAGSGNLTLSNVSNDPLVGSISLQGINTFTGSVLVQKGVVTFTQDKSFTGIGNAITLGSAGNSASLYSTASSQILANNITVAATSGSNVIGSTSASASKSEYSGSMVLNGGVIVSSNKTTLGEVRLSGIISGAGSLTTTGSGAVTLSAANTFAGDTRVAGTGNLQLGVTGASSLALQNSTVDLNAADSGNIVFGSTVATSITSATFGGLKGSRNLVLVNSNTTTPAAVALSIGNNNASNSYSGGLSGSGSFIKVGTGTQTLSGANSHTGGTTVTAGTLLINGSNVGSAVTVSNAGSVLGGTGTIAPGTSHSLTVGNAATLVPGTDGTVGTLTVSLASTGDAASFASGAKFAFDLNAPGTNDVLAFTGLTASGGEITFNGNVVNFTNLGGLAAGSYTLFTFDAATDYSGTLAIGTGLGAFSGSSSFTYNTNSIVLNVVPEPSAVAMTGIGFAGMLYLLRRRRNS